MNCKIFSLKFIYRHDRDNHNYKSRIRAEANTKSSAYAQEARQQWMNVRCFCGCIID